jgi:hypothetical protein
MNKLPATPQLQEKGIGLDFALFYEAYATYYELRGNCSAADAVYQDGINRHVLLQEADNASDRTLW